MLRSGNRNDNIKYDTTPKPIIKPSPQKYKKDLQDRFVQGYICAVVQLIEHNGQVDTIAYEIFRSLGCYTLQQLKDFGIDKYDLAIIEKHWDSLKNKNV